MNDQIFGGEHHAGRPARPVWTAIKRGLAFRCPSCGEGRLFSGFLTVVRTCEKCGAEMFHHRADDLPAYIVIVLVGHILVTAFMSVESTSTLSTWQHLAIWIPLTIVSALALIRPVKGGVVGLQWALYMHGFSGDEEPVETHPQL